MEARNYDTRNPFSIQGFSKENILMGKRHKKTCSTSLIIREMQIKPTIMNHFTRVRMAIIKKFTNKKCWQGCWETGTLLHCCWKCKLVATMENSMLVYLLSRVQLLQVRGCIKFRGKKKTMIFKSKYPYPVSMMTGVFRQKCSFVCDL